MSRLRGYADIANLSEDERIRIIAESVIASAGLVIGFVVEAGEGKAERYIEKLNKRYPAVEVIDTVAGPVPDTVTVRLRKKADA